MFSFLQTSQQKVQTTAEDKTTEAPTTNLSALLVAGVEQITTIDIFFEDIKKWLNQRRFVQKKNLHFFSKNF